MPEQIVLTGNVAVTTDPSGAFPAILVETAPGTTYVIPLPDAPPGQKSAREAIVEGLSGGIVRPSAADLANLAR